MTVHADFETFELQPAIELPEPLTFGTTDDALAWLKRLWAQDSDLMSQLRRYLAQYSVDNPESFRLNDYQLLERWAYLLYTRRIVVLRKSRTVAGGGPSKKPQEYAPPFPLSKRRRRAAPNSTWKLSKNWISIELRDTDSHPIAGEEYKIELPDGRVVEGKLDRMGTAGVSGIDPGQCKVSFPRLAGATWAHA